MNSFTKSLPTVRCLFTKEILFFRSQSKVSQDSKLRMASTLSIETLRSKSTLASELIEKLKTQIEQIKLASSPAAMADRAKNLQKENEELKKKVEQLKKELETAEAKNSNYKAGKII